MKNLWKCILRASSRVSFSYFFKIAFDYGAAHWYLFRISRIILQYSVQALSNIYDRALWQKINNNLKTAVDHCHRELGLKCGRALRSNSETHIQQKKKKNSARKKCIRNVKYIQVTVLFAILYSTAICCPLLATFLF